MKNGLLLLNGEKNFVPNVEDYDYVVCADNAYKKAKENQIPTNLVVGDFDSYGEVPKGVDVVCHEVEKNATDGQLGVEALINLGAEQIDIVWGEGKRLDHFFGNLTLLKRAYKMNIPARFLTCYETIYYAKNDFDLDRVKGKTISIVPFGDFVEIDRTFGFYYDASGLVLTNIDTRGISNIAVEDKIKITTKKGDYLVIVNKEII